MADIVVIGIILLAVCHVNRYRPNYSLLQYLLISSMKGLTFKIVVYIVDPAQELYSYEI